MLVTIQFPIADSRLFVETPTGRLPRPVWPRATPDIDFIPRFGRVGRRWRGGLSGWIGEGVYCSARRAVRFPALTPYAWPGQPTPFTPDIAFRRFYADGPLAKVEIGLSITPEPSSLKLKTLPADFLRHFLSLPVSIPNPAGGRTTCLLWQAGRPLAALYLRASTEAKHRQHAIPRWLVDPAIPMVYVEYSGAQLLYLGLPGRVAQLPRFPQAQLAHYQLAMASLNLRVWTVNRSSLPGDAARRLRIALLRVHAERECFMRVLTHVAAGNITFTPRGPAAQRLQDYLRDAEARVLTLRKGQAAATLGPELGETDGIEDSAVGLALELEERILPGERDAIIASLRHLDVRPNRIRNIEIDLDGRVAPDDEAVYLARARLDAAEKERLCGLLADQAALHAAGPEEYFRWIVLSLTIPQRLRNEIIGGWSGNTNLDAQRLLARLLRFDLGANARPPAILLLDTLRPTLGEPDASFVAELVTRYDAAAARDRAGAAAGPNLPEG